ncbi:hypothetical protein KY314_02875, partial [Candidatus Woesearchaeota archaeon]|nr:hypothetical protein [Candidatus Woesearchaeota archaeon]
MRRNQERFRQITNSKQFAIKAKQGVIVLMFFLLAGIAYADFSPIISLTAPTGTTVETTVHFNMRATDLIDPPMIAGIKQIKLYEDGNLIDTYNCQGKTICTHSKAVIHLTPGNKTYYAKAKDNGDNEAKSPNILITFLGPNLPPEIKTIPEQNLKEDSGNHLHLLDLWNYTSDDRIANENLTYTIFSQENTTIVSCEIENNRYFNCSLPTLNAFGSSIVTIQVSDGQLQDKENITVNIESVNDAPWLNATLPNSSSPIVFPEDMYNDSINLSYYFKDIETSYLDYSFIPYNKNLTITETAGIMNITSLPNYYGLSSLLIIASDKENSTNATIYVMVSPVNDAPEFNPLLENQTSIFNVSFEYDINATDVDLGSILNYYDNSSFFTINKTTGTIKFKPLNLGNHSIQIIVCDDSGALNNCTNSTFELEVKYMPVPGFTNVTPFNATYSENALYTFFAEIIPYSTIDKVIFAFNTLFSGGGGPATHFSANTYTVNTTNLKAGNYTYQWQANYTNGLENKSQIYNFIVLPADPGMNISMINPVEYGENAHVNCTVQTQQGITNLYVDGVPWFSNYYNTENMTGGMHNFTCVFGSSANYTSQTKSVLLNVTERNITITLNAPTSVPYGSITNVSCYSDYPPAGPALLRNNSVVNSPDNDTLPAGIYNYSCYLPGHLQNWGSQEKSAIVTIEKAIPEINLSLNGSVNQDLYVALNGSSIQINSSINIPGALMGLNATGPPGSFVVAMPPGFDLTLPLPGIYTFILTYNGSQNYTSSSRTQYVYVGEIFHKTNITPSTGTHLNKSYVNISLNTNQNTTCKWSENNIGYSSMANTFTTTGAMNHKTQVTGLELGSKTIYIACADDTATNTPLTYIVDNIIEQGSTVDTTSTAFRAILYSTTVFDNSILTNINANNSIINHSTLTNVNSTDSTIINSQLSNCIIINSTVKDKTGSNCYIVNSIVDPSDVTGSNITESEIINSNATYSVVD